MNPRLPLLALLAVAACAAPPLEAPPPALPAAQATPAANPQAAAPTLPPGLRLGRAVLPVRYRATLTVVPDDAALKGEIEIDLSLQAATDVLWLNATEITVEAASLEVGGKRIAARAVPGDGDRIGFALAEKAPAGLARLKVSYRGAISSKDDRGVFVEEDEGKRFVFTQFESIEARRAFPCFDEPSFKVPWQLTLKVKGDDLALSNTPVVSEAPAEGGMKIVRFAETKPLPSYLVAFAVGPFEMVDAGKAGANGTPVRVAVPRGKAAEARWAAASTPALLKLLEDYFGIPYPYEKLDVVPIPRLVSFGAMENPGLITFRMSLSLASAAEETVAFKRNFARVQAHELAHQWFGDLVTTEFWDDIWLNESFAEWMGSKIIERWKPEWDEPAYRAGGTASAMQEDGLASARKIRQEIATNDDIQNAFDSITYEKGATVIAMIERWVGEETFRKGIRRYLQAHAHGTATSNDFLAAIGAVAGKAVAPAFSSFLDQPGVPLVHAELKCDAGKPPRLALAQERFLPAGSAGAAATWQIPVCARYPTGGAPGEARACTLLTERAGELQLAGAKACPSWTLADQAGAGYYRVAYGQEALGTLLGKGSRALTVPERLALIRDAGALAQAGRTPIADVLALLPDLARDPSPHVLRSAAEIADDLHDPLLPAEVRPAFARFVQKAFGKKARELGLRPKPGDDDETRLVRPMIVHLVADRGEDAALVAEAQRLAGRWLDDPAAVEPEVVDVILKLAAIHGDRKLFDRLHAEVKKATDQKRRSRLLGAMASFRDPAIVDASLSLFLTDELDARDAFRLLSQDSRRNDVVFAFVKRRFGDLLKRLPGELQGRLPYLHESFCDEAHRADVEAFFKERVGKLTGGPRTLAQTLEAISLCSVRRKALEPSLTAFLKKQ